MKRILCFSLIVVLSLFVLIGCGSGDKPSPESPDTEGTAPSETYSFRLATHYNTIHPGYAALERIVADLAERSTVPLKSPFILQPARRLYSDL